MNAITPSYNAGSRRALSLLGMLAAAICLPSMAAPLDLKDCTRTTHVSHGGEANHRDLGEGRVMWTDWWSQEGTATDFAIVDCGPGNTLMFRAAEQDMNRRLPFDRRAKALAVIETHQAGARAFATFERMGADLKHIARDIEIKTLTQEPCACAALYPEARGNKEAFKLEG